MLLPSVINFLILEKKASATSRSVLIIATSRSWYQENLAVFLVPGSRCCCEATGVIVL